MHEKRAESAENNSSALTSEVFLFFKLSLIIAFPRNRRNVSMNYLFWSSLFASREKRPQMINVAPVRTCNVLAHKHSAEQFVY